VGDQRVKMFITNGDIAKYMNVFCLTDPDHKDRHQRHSFFIVETDRKGFQANKLHGKLGIRPMTRQRSSFRTCESLLPTWWDSSVTASGT